MNYGFKIGRDGITTFGFTPFDFAKTEEYIDEQARAAFDRATDTLGDNYPETCPEKEPVRRDEDAGNP